LARFCQDQRVPGASFDRGSRCGFGLILSRHDQQYVQTLVVGSGRLPAPEAAEERARLEERINQVRHFLETLDLLRLRGPRRERCVAQGIGAQAELPEA
jgi:hypothetical protein